MIMAPGLEETTAPLMAQYRDDPDALKQKVNEDPFFQQAQAVARAQAERKSRRRRLIFRLITATALLSLILTFSISHTVKYFKTRARLNVGTPGEYPPIVGTVHQCVYGSEMNFVPVKSWGSDEGFVVELYGQEDQELFPPPPHHPHPPPPPPPHDDGPHGPHHPPPPHCPLPPKPSSSRSSSIPEPTGGEPHHPHHPPHPLPTNWPHHPPPHHPPEDDLGLPQYVQAVYYPGIEDNVKEIYRREATVSFSIPALEDGFFVDSGGFDISGFLTVLPKGVNVDGGVFSDGVDSIEIPGEQLADASQTDRIEFDVKVTVYSPKTESLAKVCLIERNGQKGIGVYSPGLGRWGEQVGRRHVKFQIAARLPSIPIIKNINTKLRNFSIRLFKLADYVFPNISLSTSNGGIMTDSLNAPGGQLISSNGPIRGIFETNSSLHLSTSNSPVFAGVKMSNKNDGVPTKLKIVTSNGSVNGTIALTSTESTGGAFEVTTWTSNGKLEVNFVEQPVNSALQLIARTSNSPAAAFLHPAYEGEISVASSLFRPTVVDLHPEDPSGKRQERVLKLNENRAHLRRVSGSVWWGSEKGLPGNSSVDLFTSNSKAALIL